MNFRICIIFLYIFHSFKCFNGEDNPFKLINDDNENSEDSLDDEDDPFSLVLPQRNKPEITETEFKADLLAHSHLVKILWNKIGKSDINDSTYVHLKLTLTKEMIKDIKAYINTSNQSYSIPINQHFLYNLEKEEEKKEIIFDYEKKTSLFQNTYLKLLLICIAALCTAKWPKIGVILIFAYGVWHLDNSIKKEAELRQQYIVNKPVPDHCKNQAISKWASLKIWFKWNAEEECFQHYKMINGETTFGDNPVKIIAALTSSIFETLLKPVGHIVGNIYHGLNQHMYFHVAFLVLVMIFIFVFVLVISIIYICRRVPVVHNTPPVIEEHPCLQHKENHSGRIRQVPFKKKPRMIEYKK